jgi:hypothetical protein
MTKEGSSMKKMLIPAAAIAAAVVTGAGTSLAVAASTAAPSVPDPGAAYGCETSSRTLVDVYTNKANFQNFLAAHGGKCPTGDWIVSIGYTPPVTQPSSPPPTQPSSPPPTTPTSPPSSQPPSSPPPTDTASCTIAPGGNCGPYTDSGIFYSDKDSDYVSNQGLASDASNYQGNLTATGLSNWTASLSVKNNGGAVEGYPSSDNMIAAAGTPTSADQYPYYPQPVSSFADMSSTFASSFPHNAGTSAESAYDIWTDPVSNDIYSSGWNEETMIWTDQQNRFLNDPNGNPVACGYDSGAKVEAQNVSIGGKNWDLCLYGAEPGTSGANTDDNSEWIWYLPGDQEDSGTVDIQQFINYEIQHGDLPSDIGYTEINYGFEPTATTGTEDFTVSGLTLTGTPVSGTAAKPASQAAKSADSVKAKQMTAVAENKGLKLQNKK